MCMRLEFRIIASIGSVKLEHHYFCAKFLEEVGMYGSSYKTVIGSCMVEHRYMYMYMFGIKPENLFQLNYIMCCDWM